MLASKYRLPLKTELNRVKKEGRLVQGKLFSLQVDFSNSSKPSRFGFIISSKIHKKAVKRNRAKRLLSEAITSLLPQLKPGYEVVFLAKKKLVESDFKEIKKEVEKLFKKAKIISQ